MASSSLSPPSFQGPLIHKSQFLGQNHIKPLPTTPISSRSPKSLSIKPINAKFNLFELLGGRGLCNGEAGLEKELVKNTEIPLQTGSGNEEELINKAKITAPEVEGLPENAFDKELLGLTGGFPGGEKGLKKFIEKNPPPLKQEKEDDPIGFGPGPGSMKKMKVKPPELPLLLPGMIAIVKNPNNPYYMYCGVVQRITDGKAGVLFEGGNWDRLITFRLEELERRDKGPPMVNPKSVILEPLIEKLEKQQSS